MLAWNMDGWLGIKKNFFSIFLSCNVTELRIGEPFDFVFLGCHVEADIRFKKEAQSNLFNLISLRVPTTFPGS